MGQKTIHLVGSRRHRGSLPLWGLLPALTALACLGPLAVRANARVSEPPSPLELSLLAVAKYSAPYNYSGLIETPSGPVAVFAYGTPEKIDVWSYSGGSWGKATALSVGCCEIAGPAPAGSFTVLRIADLPVNLTVPVDFPTRPSDLAVLADVNGTWQLVPFLTPGQSPVDFVGTGGSTVSGATIVATTNNCLPDCASGGLSKAMWTYNPPQHGFTTPVASVAASPPARFDAAMAYDDATKQLVMFGGRGAGGPPSPVLHDTWTWDGAQWRQASSTGPGDIFWPPLLSYDDASGQLLLLAGNGGEQNEMLETWVWSGSSWNQLPAAESPPNFDDAASYDAASGQVVLLVEDGESGAAHLATQTWLWDGHTWSQAHPAHAPPPTVGQPLAYDATSKRLILQGGGGIGPAGAGFGTFNTATWAWNGSDWITLAPSHHPPESPNAAMAYDPTKKQLWLVNAGGGPGCSLGNGPAPASIWSWSGSDWSSHNAPSDLALREGAALGYDAATKQLVLFGGCDNTGATDGTTILDGPQPSQVPPPTQPGQSAGKCDSLIDTGFSASYERKWVKNINDQLKNKANELAKNHGLPIPFFSVNLPASLALNFEPSFEPFNAQVCAIGLGGTLKGPLWTAPSDQFSLGLNAGSSPLSSVTYSADVGGWTLAPDAPPGQNLSTVWLPDIHIASGPSLTVNSLSRKGLKAELDLAEIDLGSAEAKWPLVVRGNEVLEAELGPTLALTLDVQKKDLVDELAKKIKELDDSGNPTDDEIKTAEQEVADEVGEDMAVEVESFETGYLRVTLIQDLASNNAVLIIDSIEQEVASELAAEVAALQPGSADLGEFEADSVTPEELSTDATALLEGDATGDAVLGGGRLVCVALAGGPADVFGDIFCAVV